MAPKFPDKSVFVAGTAYNWFPAWRSIPHTTDDTGRPGVPARAVGFSFESEGDANLVFALLCSSIGYWWWAVASDGFNLKKWLIESFPLSATAIPEHQRKTISNLGEKLKTELEKNYVYKDNKGRKGNFNLPACGAITREIDEVIANTFPEIGDSTIENIRLFNAGFSRSASKE